MELIDLNQFQFRYITGPRLWEGQCISVIKGEGQGAQWRECNVVSVKEPAFAEEGWTGGDAVVEVVYKDNGAMEAVNLEAVGVHWQMKEMDARPL